MTRYTVHQSASPFDQSGRTQFHASKFEAMKYQGFAENGREVELWLGEAFETHLPSVNALIVRSAEGELTVNQGDWIIRDIETPPADGWPYTAEDIENRQ